MWKFARGCAGVRFDGIEQVTNSRISETTLPTSEVTTRVIEIKGFESGNLWFDVLGALGGNVSAYASVLTLAAGIAVGASKVVARRRDQRLEDEAKRIALNEARDQAEELNRHFRDYVYDILRKERNMSGSELENLMHVSDSLRRQFKDGVRIVPADNAHEHRKLDWQEIGEKVKELCGSEALP